MDNGRKLKKHNKDLTTEQVKSKWLAIKFKKTVISLQKHLCEKPPVNYLKNAQPNTCVQVKPENKNTGGVSGK